MTKEQRAWRDMAIGIVLVSGALWRVYARVIRGNEGFSDVPVGVFVAFGVAGVGFIAGWGLLRVRSARKQDARDRESSLEGAGAESGSIGGLAAKYAAMAQQCRATADSTRNREEKAIALTNADEFEQRALAMEAYSEAANSDSRIAAVQELRALLESYPGRYREALLGNGAKKSTARAITKMLESRDHGHWRELEQARRLEAEALREAA